MAKPKVLPPAFPSELIAHIISRQTYPTTLIICCSRADFEARLIDELQIKRQPPLAQELTEDGNITQEPRAVEASACSNASILSAPLYQIAVARHIRTVFVPTASHLRAFLSVFSATDPSAAVSKPPPIMSNEKPANYPLLLVYGLLDLHRDTSEWSAQGVCCTVAGLVDAAHGAGFEAVVVEPRIRDGSDRLDELLAEDLPVLSGSARRLGMEGDGGGGWTGRTVTVRRVLAKWFRFDGKAWNAE